MSSNINTEINNVDDLANLCAEIEIPTDALILNYSDNELLNLYNVTKAKYTRNGLTLSQTFLAKICRLDDKILHAFVSRDPIKTDGDRTKLMKVIYSLSENPHSEELQKNIFDTFSLKYFVKSPRKGVNVATDTAGSQNQTKQIAELNIKLKSKENEIMYLKRNLEEKSSALDSMKILVDQMKNSVDDIKGLKIEVESKDTKIMELEVKLAEKSLAVNLLNKSVLHHRELELMQQQKPKPQKRKMFNRFA